MIRCTSAQESKSVLDEASLRDLVEFEYRSMVIRQLQITVEWQQIEWLDQAACSLSGVVATQQTCACCPVRAPCLAAALAASDPAPWRGGICHSEREELWEYLESVFTALRDSSFMHLDRLVDGRGTG